MLDLSEIRAVIAAYEFALNNPKKSDPAVARIKLERFAYTDMKALCDEVEADRTRIAELKSNLAESDCLVADHADELHAANKQIAVLNRALEMACEDAADGCCPDEMTDYVCPNVQTCPNANGKREDLGLDKECWNGYYIQCAREEMEK